MNSETLIETLTTVLDCEPGKNKWTVIGLVETIEKDGYGNKIITPALTLEEFLDFNSKIYVMNFNDIKHIKGTNFLIVDEYANNNRWNLKLSKECEKIGKGYKVIHNLSKLPEIFESLETDGYSKYLIKNDIEII